MTATQLTRINIARGIDPRQSARIATYGKSGFWPTDEVQRHGESRGLPAETLAVCAQPLVVAATIEDAVNDHDRSCDVNGDGGAPFRR